MRKDDFINLLTALNINEKELLELARETGFIQRTRKIDSLDFMYALTIESTHGIASYNDIAVSFENESEISITRQAIWKKVTESCVDYFKFVLALVILGKAKKYYKEAEVNKCKFNRILIQDSTIIRLPKRLFELFSGVSNAHSTVCHARIQGIYDLLSGRFISFTINPYSKNDQACVSYMKIEKDDLTLRDRGYLTVDEIKRHLQTGAHCIYRYKTGMQLLDYKTAEPINIPDALKKDRTLDLVVRLNDKDRTPVRIVAKPVDQETADNRRRKAKKDIKGHHPSKQFLQLQSWSVYITTIPSEMADVNRLLEIYALRWRIEIIFKSWKSNLHFDSIHNVSHNQLFIIIMARMIMFLLITQIIYKPCNTLIYSHINKTISLLKVTRYLSRNPHKIIAILNELQNYSGDLGQTIKTLGLFCAYEKRKKRQNFDQKLCILFA
jgi:hypothetical protein